MTAIEELHAMGQSIWYDNIQRSMLQNGSFAKLIESGDIRGVTSNPSIFHNAISKSHDYDSTIASLAHSDLSTEALFIELAIEDIRSAADLFHQLYEKSSGGDGYVSLEVNPRLARDTQATIDETRRLWKVVDRPNLMIKIPATEEGLPAIQAAIADGFNINVTLIFSIERYRAVMEMFISGLEQRIASRLPVTSIASVASFFVSRVDSKIDAKLQTITKNGTAGILQAEHLLGKAAIANARLAYQEFQEVFESERFRGLAAKGARLQRPLWASTSTKNPSYRDVMYVEELIGPNTVNTMPPQTLDAFRDHGFPRQSIEEDLEGCRKNLDDLNTLGISMAQVTSELELEGVKAFADAYDALLATLQERRVSIPG
jgi:transaldolase